MHDEGHFPLVTIFDMDIVVSPMNVKLGEVVNIFQLVHEVRDERERIGITGGMFIEVVVILARAEFPVFLFDKEEGGGLWGVGGMDFPSREIFFEEVFGDFPFIGGEQVDFANLGHEGVV